MSNTQREIEGTWEEIAAQGFRFAGQRVRLTLLDAAEIEEKVIIPQRPEPTPEQAALGITPAAHGSGSYRDIKHFYESHSPLTDAEFDAFEEAIAENRAMRRQLAKEKEA